MKLDWTPEEVKALRKYLGLTQTGFAKVLLVNRQQSISGWETSIIPNRTSRILLGQLYEKCGSPVLQTWEGKITDKEGSP